MGGYLDRIWLLGNAVSFTIAARRSFLVIDDLGSVRAAFDDVHYTNEAEGFRTEDKIERAFVDPREMQYLYQDGDHFVFMDKENYEQMTLDADFLEGQAGYLLPNTDVQINFYNGRAIGV